MGERVDGWERISIKHRAANFHRRKGRERTIVHHHAEILAAMHDLVSRLRLEARRW
jgi:hypothetical protein